MTEQPSYSQWAIAELKRCEPWIRAAIDRGTATHGFEDIAKAVLACDMQLWADDTGCAVTEVMVYPKRKVMNIFLAGGELEAVGRIVERIERFAPHIGVQSLTYIGRPGWAKFGDERGWAGKLVFMEKDLVT